MRRRRAEMMRPKQASALTDALRTTHYKLHTTHTHYHAPEVGADGREEQHIERDAEDLFVLFVCDKRLLIKIVVYGGKSE